MRSLQLFSYNATTLLDSASESDQVLTDDLPPSDGEQKEAEGSDLQPKPENESSSDSQDTAPEDGSTPKTGGNR